MARLLHLSDLHFGRVRPGLAAALVQIAQELRADVTVISGDLTQRARESEFAEAAALIAALPGPVLCVPGNHDLPLHTPLARLFRPLACWWRFISRETEPRATLAGLCVIGMDTADPFAWQRGRVRRASLARACADLRAAPPGALRVVAMHHPLDTPAASGKAPMRGARRASEALAAAGADVILCGHLHAWAAAPHALREGGRRMLCVQAGTTLSTRLRGEENDFNLIEHEAGLVRVTRFASGGDSTRFRAAGVTLFRQDDLAAGWNHGETAGAS